VEKRNVRGKIILRLTVRERREIARKIKTCKAKKLEEKLIKTKKRSETVTKTGVQLQT
jgi:hypothetical protein